MKSPRRALEQVHRWYYEAAETTWKNTRWFGVETQKCPLDLWIYQELITQIRPSWILETGTLFGGSALFLATVCEAVCPYAQVLTVDIERRSGRPEHHGITYLTGNSVAQDTILAVYDRMLGGDGGPRLVILDSDHHAAHVLEELRAYAPLVTPGSYVVVEDTNLGHEVVPDFGPGPREAVAEWLAEQHLGFVVDRECERLGLTFNGGGFLRRAE